MEFFDCNVHFGYPTKGSAAPVGSISKLLEAIRKAGIYKALVWHITQHDASPQVGNKLLSDAIQPYPNLYGCWTLLPTQTGELPPPEVFFAKMKTARILALRTFPRSHLYPLNRLSFGKWLDPMMDLHIPLILSLRRGCEWQDIYSLLSEFPDLLCIICDHGCWGMDRMFRPLLERYPNVYIDTAQYFVDGGIEALVNNIGYERILFGSGFPESYFGGIMLMLKHARISDEAKSAIANENLERILSEVKL